MSYILFSLIYFVVSNFLVFQKCSGLFLIFLPFYIAGNFCPVFSLPCTKRLKNCAKGNALLIEFLGSAALSIALFILSFTTLLPLDNIFKDPKLWIINTLIAIVLEAVVFWNGMLRIFFFVGAAWNQDASNRGYLWYDTHCASGCPWPDDSNCIR